MQNHARGDMIRAVELPADGVARTLHRSSAYPLQPNSLSSPQPTFELRIAETIEF